jgi:3-deoxy-D-manno-octulosonate 8-phosphate phosphatase (KDO 8-P phosphatase)
MSTSIEDVRAVALDSLGVLFGESVLVHPKEGEYLRTRSHIDGQGISYLRAAGVPIAFISSEKTGYLEYLGDKLNNLPSVASGAWHPIAIFTGEDGKDKVGTLTTWLSAHGLTMADCAYMGDDIADLAVFRQAGFSAAPVQAEESVKKAADFVATRRGGDGAVRDLANAILEAKGIDLETLSRT